MDTYKVGNGTFQITLIADIDTIGLAASRAIVIDLNVPGPGLPVAHSQDATGDIPQTEIGSADLVRNKRLSILTKIDLIGDEAARKAESERLTGKYTLNGGEESLKVFTAPIKTVHNNFSTVFLHKPIDLI